MTAKLRIALPLLARIAAPLALAACSAVALAGCGAGASAQTTSQVTTFPGLGYKYFPPNILPGVPHGTVLVVDLRNLGRVRPQTMFIDSDATFSDATWTDWGAASAIGHGTATVRICNPDCGGGPIARYPATLVLSHPRACRSYRFYESATMTLDTVDGPRPWGAYLTDPCNTNPS